MGLDLIPLGKPKLGYEEEHARLFEALKEAAFFDIPSPPFFVRLKQRVEVLLGRRVRSDVSTGRLADGPILLRQLEDISVSPYDTLCCPRAGIDPVADPWLRSAYDESNAKREGKSFEQFRQDIHGEYVLALAPPSPGLPHYASGPGQYVEGYAFRGKALTLEGIEDILGLELYNKAWMHLSPQELVEYSDELEEAALRHAQEHDISRDVMALEAGDDCSHEEEQLLILLSLARWCRYWGENGHPVWSDY
ncbi:hypothetical protein [Microvirga arabica]|nr:hypothetical protein [Microvirga arabica]